jgi:CheY-like chemotaxis protein
LCNTFPSQREDLVVATKISSPSTQKTTTSARICRNVLIIEDDLDTAGALGLMLLSEGYGVRHVLSRDEAVPVLNTYIYDVILMDYFMNGMEAKEFVDSVRSTPLSKFVLMTASGKIDEIAKTLDIDSCLPKPFDPNDLLKLLRSFDEGTVLKTK